MNYKFLFSLNIFLINLGGYIKFLTYAILDYKLLYLPRKNKKLLKENKTDVCYVCGLGPSFRNVDLNKIDGDTIVVNNFYKIGINFSHFIPSYYLIADKGFATPYHINDLMEALKLYIGKRTKFLLNSALYASEAFIGYPEDQLFYMSNFKGLFNHKKSIIINRINPAFGNVACVAIGYAIALGYKKIVLLGCDFNSFAHTTQAHCYNDASHKRRISMDFELFNYSFDAKIHIELAQYAERIGVEIVNSTKGSLIDAYPVKIDETLYFND